MYGVSRNLNNKVVQSNVHQQPKKTIPVLAKRHFELLTFLSFFGYKAVGASQGELHKVLMNSICCTVIMSNLN